MCYYAAPAKLINLVTVGQPFTDEFGIERTFAVKQYSGRPLPPAKQIDYVELRTESIPAGTPNITFAHYAAGNRLPQNPAFCN